LRFVSDIWVGVLWDTCSYRDSIPFYGRCRFRCALLPTDQERSCTTENRAGKNKLNNSDNQSVEIQLGRAMQQKIMLASIDSPVKEELSDLINSYKKAGGTMMAK
jgi:hypothetical protein